MALGHHSSISIEKLKEAMVMYDDAIDLLPQLLKQYPAVPLLRTMTSRRLRNPKQRMPNTNYPQTPPFPPTIRSKSFVNHQCPSLNPLRTGMAPLSGLVMASYQLLTKKTPNSAFVHHTIAKGAIRPRGAACSFIYETNVDKGPATTFECWAKLVNETDQLAWNSELVSPVQLKTKYVESPNKVTVASAKK